MKINTLLFLVNRTISHHDISIKKEWKKWDIIVSKSIHWVEKTFFVSLVPLSLSFFLHKYKKPNLKLRKKLSLFHHNPFFFIFSIIYSLCICTFCILITNKSHKHYVILFIRETFIRYKIISFGIMVKVLLMRNLDFLIFQTNL